MKKGQTIWAIDPCETFGGQHTLTVGKSYVIEYADDNTIVFTDVLLTVEEIQYLVKIVESKSEV